MRTASRWVLVAAVAVTMVGMASAQEQQRRQRPGGGQPGGGFGGMTRGGGGGAAMLLANEGVQKELKLTDDQKAKVKEFSENQRAKMREAFGGGQPDREKMQEVFKAAGEASEKFVKENLNPDQQKRIKQIEYQQMGFRAFTNEDVQKTLKLTDDQKEKVKTLGEDMRKDSGELMRDMRGGGDAAAEARKKLQAITKDYNAKAMDILTADQKSAWKDMTGEPFEVKFDRGTGAAGRPEGGTGGDTNRRRRGGSTPPPAEKKPDPEKKDG
jgi:Spy/CpxP family protein refolding chaperone